MRSRQPQTGRVGGVWPRAGRLAASGGSASLAVQAAFIPTKHGTNAYTDELF